MAYRDVKEYYLSVQADFLKMKNDLTEFQKSLGDKVTQDQIDNVSAMINNLKNNYDRLSYIMYLFNLPKSKKSKLKIDKTLEKYFIFNNSTKEYILKEDMDVLKELRDFIKKESNING